MIKKGLAWICRKPQARASAEFVAVFGLPIHRCYAVPSSVLCRAFIFLIKCLA